MLDDNNIEFLHLLYVLKFKLDIEHKICKMNNTTQTFNKVVFLYDQMWYQHNFHEIKLFIIKKTKTIVPLNRVVVIVSHVRCLVSISQEHVSGRSAWQNTQVGCGGRITPDHRSSMILPLNPMSVFWQANLPWSDVLGFISRSHLCLQLNNNGLHAETSHLHMLWGYSVPFTS